MNLCNDCENKYMQLKHNEITGEHYFYYYCAKKHESNFGIMFRQKCKDYKEENE